MVKQMARLDSACQKGAKILFHGVLIVVGDGLGTGKVCWGRILKIGKSEMFSLPEPQPLMLWQNGVYDWIQRIKKV